MNDSLWQIVQQPWCFWVEIFLFLFFFVVLAMKISQSTKENFDRFCYNFLLIDIQRPLVKITEKNSSGLSLHTCTVAFLKSFFTKHLLCHAVSCTRIEPDDTPQTYPGTSQPAKKPVTRALAFLYSHLEHICCNLFPGWIQHTIWGLLLRTYHNKGEARLSRPLYFMPVLASSRLSVSWGRAKNQAKGKGGKRENEGKLLVLFFALVLCASPFLYAAPQLLTELLELATAAHSLVCSENLNLVTILSGSWVVIL